MNPPSPQPPLSQLSPVKSGEFSAYLSAFLVGLSDYDLKPKERHFLCLLAAETFGKNRLAVTVDFDTWAKRMGTDRPNALRVVFLELVGLGIIDHDTTLALCQLRPDPNTWSRLRGLRSASAQSTCDPRTPTPAPEAELPLTTDRPLNTALTEISRESAITRHAPEEMVALRKQIDWSTVRDAVDNPDHYPESPPDTPPQKIRAPIASLGTEVPKLLTSLSPPENGGSAQAPGARDDAWNWLLKTDQQTRYLSVPRNLDKWSELCRLNPSFVLEKLKPELTAAQADTEVRNPMGYIYAIARREKQIR